ncbi:N6-adenosine-methyltransferase subunit [Oopsacas minuta]|uniref:N6-adenosine-methyltransferase subunit n=1 Tax=Oopsacas minuta TaxID=111878 RepID=A0AAV7KGH1_9METZ|nr:N6-adenosine-methyltransferase subunit [Oopsacas minuta]
MINAYNDILTLKQEEFYTKELRKRKREEISVFLSERNNKLKSDSILSHSPSTEAFPVFPPAPNSAPLSVTDQNTHTVPVHHLIPNPQWDQFIEEQLLQMLCSWNPDKPSISSLHLCGVVRKRTTHKQLSHITLLHILDKLAFSGLITINSKCPTFTLDVPLKKEDIPVYDLSYVDVYKVKAYLEEAETQNYLSKNIDTLTDEELSNLIEDLLQATTYRERENKRVGDEIKDLLERPTVKERYIQEKFRTQGGSKLRTFCPSGTKEECRKARGSEAACKRLHFKKLINQHTDETLGE